MTVEQCTHSDATQQPDLMTQLRRCEGQIRGIQKMLKQDRYCVEIQVQIATAENTVHQVGLSLLEAHTKRCVTDALENHNEQEKVNELMTAIRQFTKA